ncbi:MAG: glycosyltransferase family 9 protein [Synergistaceae bacterium]
MGYENKKVLIVRFSSLGDVIIANYSVKKIKEKNPHWHITWLVDSMYLDIVKSQPWVDDVIGWDRRNERNRGFINTLKDVRSRGFDVLIDMHNTDRSSFFSFFSNIPERYVERYRLPFAHNIHSFDKIINLKEKLTDCSSYLHVSEKHSAISDYFRDGKNNKRLTLAIGASYKNKRWPVHRWIEFCKSAIEVGFVLYLVGDGRDEITEAAEIVSSVNSENLVDLVGKMSLIELIQTVNKTDATISGDTGVLHIARALGKNIIGLFGPNVLPDDYMSSLTKTFFSNCPDLGCRNWKCSKPCLETIEVPAVLNSVKMIMERSDFA